MTFSRNTFSQNVRRPGQGGFTLVEMSVALGVTVIVMLGILFLFDFNNRLTRVQTNVADMQQSLRIAQYDMVRMARMAGRGGLSGPQGVVIRRDVDDEAHVIPDDDNSPKVLQGTDVLTVRGVFSTPIYQLSFTNPGAYEAPDALGKNGKAEICRVSPSGSLQDLDAIATRLQTAEALILVSPIGDQFYAAVALDTNKTDPDEETTTCPAVATGRKGYVVWFNTDSDYQALSAAPELEKIALSKVAYVGFLEEYRFYIREDHEVKDDEDSALTPVLSRARLLPNKEIVYPGGSLEEDIADGIFDLQIAMGIDVNGDGTVTEDLEHPEADEWQGNSLGEGIINGGLKGIRINTLARTQRADAQYTADVVNQVEDHVYPLDDTDPINTEKGRRYRRRVMQTVVNLRNLTT